MMNKLASDVPVGDIQFYDNFVPALDAGNWNIRVEHTLSKDSKPLNIDDKGAVVSLATEQEFVVSAPQFSLPPADIANQFPPIGSTGLYGEVLPHIVLADPLLPWERGMTGTSERAPWLALLVLDPSEIIGPETVATREQATTASQFMQAESGIIKPAIVKEDDIADDAPCFRVRLPVSVFQEIMPRLEELRFLTHCRQVNTGDKAVAGIDANGLFSVVVANRFPKRPSAASDPALPAVVHLVSVEGLEAYLTDKPAFGANTAVDLLSLARWTFQTLPDNSEDFRGLVDALVESQSKQPTDAKTLCAALKVGDLCPDKAWLRLPQRDLPTGAVGTEAAKRLADGFVPLPVHTRTGADTFAWYRGPLTPLVTTKLQKDQPFQTSDAALIYDAANGVFDMSLAAAWNIGRAAALADRSFGQKLLDFRRRGQRLTDKLWNQLQSQHFSATQIQHAAEGTQVQDEFLSVLDTQLVADINSASVTKAPTPAGPTPVKPQQNDPKAAVAAFLADTQVQDSIRQTVAEDLDPIANWLAHLILLGPVPFDYLVPDAAILPTESLRFFHLDANWLGAMVDGALSIGLDSSRQTFFHAMTHGLLSEAARDAVKVYRNTRPGVRQLKAAQSDGPVSGFLLRSALVSGWPNLAIRPRLNYSDDLLRILRLEHLSASVLLCMVDGVPDYFEFCEPQESFRFGTDDDGMVPLRNLLAPKTANDPALGEQLAGDPMFQLRDLSEAKPKGMRSAAGRVLNLAPGDPNGLIAQMTAANQQHSTGKIAPLSPGSFALQMVKAPEAIKFVTRNVT
ncbi:hypothetical protein [Roseibium sp.]|uniref:hypothetical protein n=1 Tax=Roseibium sp. TaxID=1936156 RepID=UPI003A985547